jgi:hypothetical protein
MINDDRGTVPEARRERGEGTTSINLKGGVLGAELTGESHGSGGGTDPSEEMWQPVTVVGRSVAEEDEEAVGCLEAAETHAGSKNGDVVAQRLPGRNKGKK